MTDPTERDAAYDLYAQATDKAIAAANTLRMASEHYEFCEDAERPSARDALYATIQADRAARVAAADACRAYVAAARHRGAR